MAVTMVEMYSIEEILFSEFIFQEQSHHTISNTLDLSLLHHSLFSKGGEVIYLVYMLRVKNWICIAPYLALSLSKIQLLKGNTYSIQLLQVLNSKGTGPHVRRSPVNRVCD